MDGGKLMTIKECWMQTAELPVAATKNAVAAIAWFLLAIIVAFGVHLRTVAYTDTQIENPIRADAREYFAYALNLKNWNVFSKDFVAPGSAKPPAPDALRSPGFPYFGKYFVADDVESMLAGTLRGQTFLQVLAFLFLTWVFVRMLGVGWAVPAALLLWTFPHFVSINTYYLSESLFTSLMAIAVGVAWCGSQQPKHLVLGWAACGAVIGMAALTRPVMEHFALFMLLACVLFFRQHWKAVLAFAVCAVVPVLLWKLRNVLAVGETSDPTLLVNGFYHGSFPGFMYFNNPESLGVPYRFDPRSAETAQGLGPTLNLIWGRMVQAPAEYVQWYLFGKPQFLWQWWGIDGQGDIYIYLAVKSPYYSLLDFHLSHVVNKAVHPFWVVIGLVGAVTIGARAAFTREPASLFLLLLALIVIYATLVHMVLAPFPRYGIPFKVCLIPLSVLAIKETSSWLLQRLQKKSQ
jgi:hypothetical protein